MTLTKHSRRLKQFGRCCPAFLLANLFLIGNSAGYSQSIAVTTELVVLPVRVIDRDGGFVSGLNVDNFRIYQDGRLQRVSLFQREDIPVTVGLVVDHSRSMGPKLPEMAAAISSFAQSSNPQDEMFVVDFSDRVSLALPSGKPFTHDQAELARAAAAASMGGGTALYDGVYEGLKHLELTRGDKKALLIVSDGGDNASKHKYSEVLALARRSQTVIYSIGLVGAPDQEDQDRKVLQRLASDTGGIAFFPDAQQTVAMVTARIARALRQQYTLGFAADKTGSDHSFRRIEVKVSAPGHGKIHIQTRPGYSTTELPALAEKRGS